MSIDVKSASEVVDNILMERVHIDGGDVVGLVTAVTFRPGYAVVEVSWMHDGESRSAWFDVGRVAPVS